MHIALFGGSFDPPHNGHLKIADTLIAEKYCDVVWFVPCAQHPYQKDLSPAKYRLSMLEKLKKVYRKGIHKINSAGREAGLGHGHPICTYELDKSTTSYSIETLEYFQKLHPTDTFSWVIGSDQLKNFNKWHRYQDILNNFKVLVYPRTGFPMNPLLPGMEKMENVETIDTSSTEIKKLLENNESIDSHTITEIVQYIKNNNLY